MIRRPILISFCAAGATRCRKAYADETLRFVLISVPVSAITNKQKQEPAEYSGNQDPDAARKQDLFPKAPGKFEKVPL